MTNISFPMCAFLISLLLVIIFYSKKRIDNIDTKIYGRLLLLSLSESLLACTIVFLLLQFGKINLIYILDKIDYFIILTEIYILYKYIRLTTSNNEKNFSILFIVYIIGAISIIVLPIEVIFENGVIDTAGPSSISLYLTCIVLFLGIAFYIIKSKLSSSNKVATKKIIPLYILILLGVLMLIIRFNWPEILLISLVISYVLLIMYFTIENPDIKLLNEVEAARDKAEKANAAKTDFLSSMSHEIRTPLNAIVGFSEAIQDEEDLASAKQDAKDIILASQNLLEIVNGILDISKIEANKMEITNCDYSIIEECQTIYKLIKPRIGEKPIEFIMNVAPDIPNTLYGDKGKIKEIITNLLTNAVKYTEKGTITFDISCINKNNNSTIIISVEDTGRGIKPEKIDKLFTKFERLDEDRNTTLEGTGLGLAITKRLVEMLNGKIIVQSVFGSGSKFTVYLPQIISANQKIETIKKENNLDLSTKKVLVVDDNDLNLKIAERLLKKYNLQIETCKSGYECLDKINNNQKYDLIFMDDMMPKMSGTETLHILKDNPDFKTKVIVLTANAIEGMKEKYIEDGFNDYLAKPIEKEELERILRHYLNSEIESANFAPLPKELYQIDDNVIKKLNSKEFIENKKV